MQTSTCTCACAIIAAVCCIRLEQYLHCPEHLCIGAGVYGIFLLSALLQVYDDIIKRVLGVLCRGR